MLTIFLAAFVGALTVRVLDALEAWRSDRACQRRLAAVADERTRRSREVAIHGDASRAVSAFRRAESNVVSLRCDCGDLLRADCFCDEVEPRPSAC